MSWFESFQKKLNELLWFRALAEDEAPDSSAPAMTSDPQAEFRAIFNSGPPPSQMAEYIRAKFTIERVSDTDIRYTYNGDGIVWVGARVDFRQIWDRDEGNPREPLIRVAWESHDLNEYRPQMVGVHPLTRGMSVTVTVHLPITQEAEERAYALLLSCLSNEQKHSLRKHGWFRVPSKKMKDHFYGIHVGRSGNVVLYGEHGLPVTRLCAVVEDVPTSDVLLAQKLMLECNEEHFLEVANKLPW